ncbi:MAG: ribulose-bisphosphate carboxylase small chain [Acidimicrobiaceae bacterium]|nr:MAG: ribulose-bisphosphate carboxylase small chain [Acidimicrobiaceae bacterium]
MLVLTVGEGTDFFALDDTAIHAQVLHIVHQGWNCAVEHVEPGRATAPYWYLWKLPMFGEPDPEVILGEIAACRTANPGHHVRLIGLDNHRQTQGMSMVVARGPTS